MLPDKNNKKWISLVKGEIKHDFKVISASMLISRLSRHIKKNDTQEAINDSINEAYEFFKKYENIFQEDINEIFK